LEGAVEGVGETEDVGGTDTGAVAVAVADEVDDEDGDVADEVAGAGVGEAAGGLSDPETEAPPIADRAPACLGGL